MHPRRPAPEAQMQVFERDGLVRHRGEPDVSLWSGDEPGPGPAVIWVFCE
jgi:hypothetical protein